MSDTWLLSIAKQALKILAAERWERGVVESETELSREWDGRFPSWLENDRTGWHPSAVPRIQFAPDVTIVAADRVMKIGNDIARFHGWVEFKREDAPRLTHSMQVALVDQPVREASAAALLRP